MASRSPRAGRAAGGAEASNRMPERAPVREADWVGMASRVTDSVLLIAFGGPSKREEIRPFLENVARGRGIAPERIIPHGSLCLMMKSQAGPMPNITRGFR